MQYFDRICKVTVSERTGVKAYSISDFKITFDVQKSDEPTNNEYAVNIYNLSDATSGNLRNAGKYLRLQAGYKDTDLQTVFWGEILHSNLKREKTDKILEFKCVDFQKSSDIFISKSYDGDTSLKAVLRDIISLSQYSFSGINFSSFSDKIIKGSYVVHGYSTDEIKKICGILGVLFSIQNGALIIKTKESNTNLVVSLSPETGLIDSPEIVFEKDESGKEIQTYKIKSLLLPQLNPRDVVLVKSADHPEGIRIKIKSITHNGDTFGDIWESMITGEAIK